MKNQANKKRGMPTGPSHTRREHGGVSFPTTGRVLRLALARVAMAVAFAFFVGWAVVYVALDLVAGIDITVRQSFGFAILLAFASTQIRHEVKT